MTDPDPSRLVVLDADTIAELREIMEDEFQDLLRTFLADMPELFAGIEAATAAGDAEALRQNAHTLKSSSASLGALQLSELARRLERLGHDRDLAAAAPVLDQCRQSVEQTRSALEALLQG